MDGGVYACIYITTAGTGARLTETGKAWPYHNIM